MQGYLNDPEISFCAVGDATDSDASPLQICDFAKVPSGGVAPCRALIPFGRVSVAAVKHTH